MRRKREDGSSTRFFAGCHLWEEGVDRKSSYSTTSSAEGPDPTLKVVLPRRRRALTTDDSQTRTSPLAQSVLAPGPTILPRPPTPPPASPPKVVYKDFSPSTPEPPARFQRSVSEPHDFSENLRPPLARKDSSTPPSYAPDAWKAAHDIVLSRGRSASSTSDSPYLSQSASRGVTQSESSVTLVDPLLDTTPVKRKKWDPLAAFGAPPAAVLSPSATVPAPTRITAPSSVSPTATVVATPTPSSNLLSLTGLETLVFDPRRASLEKDGYESVARPRPPKASTSSLHPDLARLSILDRPLSDASSAGMTVVDTTPRQSMAGPLFNAAHPFRPSSLHESADPTPSRPLSARFSTAAELPHPTSISPRILTRDILPEHSREQSQETSYFPDHPSTDPLSCTDLDSLPLVPPPPLRSQSSNSSLSRSTPPLSPYLRTVPSLSSSQLASSLSMEVLQDEQPESSKKGSKKPSALMSSLTNLLGARRSSDDVGPFPSSLLSVQPISD